MTLGTSRSVVMAEIAAPAFSLWIIKTAILMSFGIISFMTFSLSDPIACQHSEKLTQLIRQEIACSGGFLSFARFMERALYAPGLGYYSGGLPKLGREGDFVTAPEMSPLFAKAIAKQCQQVLEAISLNGTLSSEQYAGEILEFGAGSGMFAKDLLLELEKLNALPAHYYILEISADLRERQKKLFAEHIPQLLGRIHWLNTLPAKKINGVIFANEVLDAFPVHLFKIEETEIKERCVTWKNDQFAWVLMPPTTAELKSALEKLKQECHLAGPYESEIRLMLSAWIRSVVSILNEGIILLLDYGYGRKEYYHPDRTMGTLMCYSKHQAHASPLERVGLQDITAHVDFTCLIESVDLTECSLAGFTTQADFLIGCGLLSIAQADNITEPYQQYQQAQVIKKLVFPGEMGEIVKVMALSKRSSVPLLGFTVKTPRF
jgi:SAM-dependent MidA family methyltransferase